MSHTPYLKRPLPNEKDINYGVEIEIPSGGDAANLLI